MAEPPGGPSGPARAADLVETHVSVLVMIGDRVHKLLKPVELGFLDHRRREDRERACHREAELNRRFAPDVYLGVLDVIDAAGEPVDHLVEMRRMPEGRRLSGLLASAEAPGLVDAVADAVAAAHARAEGAPVLPEAGSRDAVAADWEEGLRQLAAVAPPAVPPEEVERVRGRAREYLAGREPLFRERRASGWVRDGHGDLLADDVFCLPDGPRILDCLAFDDRLRHADVLADVAFLAMDLESRGHPELSARLVARWRERLGERHPASLAHHYVAYRAHVRAKVAAIRAAQGDTDAAGDAGRLHDLAAAHLERGRVRLVLVGGPPGTGKSTLARATAERRGWALLRSDVIRHELQGTPSGEAPLDEGRYSAAATARVYREMAERAASLLARGESVVLDASWSDADRRAAARATARSAHAAVIEIRLDAPAEVSAERIARRRAAGSDPSEATPRVAEALAARFDPWPEAHVIGSGGPPEGTADAAGGVIDRTEGGG